MILTNNIIFLGLCGLIMATTLSDTSLTKIAQWIDDIGGQLYARIQDIYALQKELNKLQSVIEDYRDDPEGRFR